MLPKVKYVGPAKDYSGYGEANRHDIAALTKAGVEVTTQIPSYCLELSDFGPLGRLAIGLQDKFKDYNVIIMHTTPDVYSRYMEDGKYHIGRVFWETDKIPEEFAQKIQLCDEVWTGSYFNKKAIEAAGVTKPIFIIPEAIEMDFNPDQVIPYETAATDTYKFYSIFEWTERKNPRALLEAYYREFQNNEQVSLTIKTYIDNFTPEKRQEIEQNIRETKMALNLPKYPPVFLYTNLMDRHQIYRFHASFDCFVSAHRGEGWGIPQMEAITMGKPVISTNCGGIHEYLENGQSAYLVNCVLTPLAGNTRNPQWYAQDQRWAEVDVSDLRAYMRQVYDRPQEAVEVGKTGREVAKKKFALDKVGSIMKDRLLQIKGLQ